MSRRLVGNAISVTAAIAAGVGTFYASIRFLSAPDTAIEWIQQICTGLTIAIIVFFVAWGHFQELPSDESPAPPQRPPQP